MFIWVGIYLFLSKVSRIRYYTIGTQKYIILYRIRADYINDDKQTHCK